MSDKKLLKFSEVPEGKRFYDPSCGEYFKKLNDAEAVFLTGGDFYEGGVTQFLMDDTVEEVGDDEQF